MHYKQLTTLLALASSAFSIPTPQNLGTSSINTPPSTLPAANVSPVNQQVDKSGAFVNAGLVGVGLSKLDNTEGLTFLMDENKLRQGQADSFVIFEPTVYEKLEVAVGLGFQPATIRCKILDLNKNEIIATRGQNRDKTFSDANNGFWTLERPSRVSEIICDPGFVANNLNAQPAA